MLEYVSEELTEKESEKLLKNFRIDDDDPQKDLLERLEGIPWLNLRKELEMMGRNDIIDHIKKKTLITKGID